MTTIEAWNIVLNAVVLVVLAAYGLWLRNIVNQQLKSKDTAIGALEAVIKIKDARISSLESDTAPAITKAYADMREHANQMTAEVQRFTVMVEDQRRAQQMLKEAQERLLREVGVKLGDVAEQLTQWSKVKQPEGKK